MRVLSSSLTSFAVVGLVVMGCNDQTLSRRSEPSNVSPGEEPGSLTPPEPEDASAPREAGACPPPGVLTPSKLGAGFLPPQTVTLVRSFDGDTASFAFPTAAEQTCRYLWIDTEETSGANMTAFGVEAKNAAAGYLRAAREIVVVVQADPVNPGQPHVDPYGRWLSLIFVDGDLLQTRLVREGWTPYYTQFGCAAEPVHSTLLHAEAEANAAKRGIWMPMHPLDYEASVNRWIGRKPWCRPNPFESAYCN